jgi:hypothetical protein
VLSTAVTEVSDGDDSPSTTSTVAAAVTGEGEALVAIKIDNDPQARPQVGLQEASLVIEAPVEGGLTRFTAFYEEGSYPVLAGPVRSVRPVDADLASVRSLR